MDAERSAARPLDGGVVDGDVAAPAVADALRPAVFSTALLPVREQFEAWRAQCSALLDMSVRRPPQAGYLASHRVWKLGAMAFSHVLAPEAAFRRGAGHIRRDSLDHWVIGVSRRGTQVLRTSSGEVRVGPRRTHLFSLHEPFEGERDDVDWLTLIVARDLFPGLAATFDAAARRPLDTAMGELLGTYMESLGAQLPRMTQAELPRAAEATRAMLAACVTPGADAMEEAREHIERARLARLKAMIRQNLRSPTLGPRRLCSLAGISRSQLYRLFEPLGGVAAFIQSERLRHAHRALSEPSDSREIARIAEEFGFYDASTFSRAFRREFGATPSEVRQAARAGHRAAPIARPRQGAMGFTEILRLL